MSEPRGRWAAWDQDAYDDHMADLADDPDPVDDYYDD